MRIFIKLSFLFCIASFGALAAPVFTGPAGVEVYVMSPQQKGFERSPEPKVTVTIPKPSALQYFNSPDLNKLGEAFVEGHIRVEGSILDVSRIAESLARSAAASARDGILKFARHTRGHDRKAIEYHYDASNQFYSLFLDRNMVYSCAYYRTDADSLDQAQEQKLDHNLGKLMLKK